MRRNLTYGVNTVRENDAVVAGTTAVAPAAVDTLGYAGVRFLIGIGTITATGTVDVKAQQSSDNGNTDDFTDIASSAIPQVSSAAAKVIVILDIYRPGKRYVRPYIARGTANSNIEFIIAERYLASSEPVTQDTSIQATKVLAQPAEGTA